MNLLTKFSLRNIAAVIIIMAMLVLGGGYSATKLKVESMPDITFPFMLVTIGYNASPSDILEQVTKPVEQSLSGIKGIKNLQSSSGNNVSQIAILLESGVKVDEFKQLADNAIANAHLPSSVDKPHFLTQGFASFPVYYMAVHGKEGLSADEINRIFSEKLKPGLMSLTGLDHIETIGDHEAAVTIELKADALQANGFNPAQVTGYMKAALASSPVGAIEADGKAQMVRVNGDLDSISKLEQMKLATPKGLIALKDLGNVKTINESKSISRINGQNAISINIYKSKEANQVKFASDIENLIEGWNKSQSELVVSTVYNESKEIKSSLEGMIKEGLLGALLASAMILIFLRNFRMTLIVLVSIPLSILTSMLFMSALGISLNIMTLGGLAISIGRVVDDSIVVIENIYSHLQKAQERNESVIKLATKQVAGAITSSTLTTVGVFVPIAFVSGIVGEVFVPFAITLVSALLASLIVALTVIPVLAKIMVMNSKSIKTHSGEPGRITRAYKKTLVWTLKHWVVTLGIALIFFVGSIFLAGKLSSELMPASNSDQYVVFDVVGPEHHTLDMTNSEIEKIEQLLNDSTTSTGDKQFEIVQSIIGYSSSAGTLSNRGYLLTQLHAGSDAKQVMKDYKEKIENIVSKDSTIYSSVISIAPSSNGGNTFTYNVKGDDLVKLQEAATMIKQSMAKFPELSDIKDSLIAGNKEVEVNVDQQKAMEHGLTNLQIMEAVNGWIGSHSIGQIKLDEKNYQATVELTKEDKQSVDQLKHMVVNTPFGQQVKLSDVANVRLTDGVTMIEREMMEQVLVVTATINDPDKQSVSNKVITDLKQLTLPSGVSTEIKGVSANLEESFQDMFVAMGAAVFIVYLVMVIAFRNASAPFAILFSLPLAAIGGILGLYITNESVNITSLIGFLMLIGIVVTNAIVLIDRVQQLREQGYSVREALVEGGMSRLRPIIMTAVATIMTLMPLAVGLSNGALISKGLSVVVIGGLVVSTLLTLVIVPIVYERNEVIKAFFARVFLKKTNASKGTIETRIAEQKI
ncbi:efflux RND transporter permease subunit [Paenibacillus albiflavus]|uniref:Efflux RND transporter permease subunit n=1 Tax=Paenibacillus albiflavus TaxID=2545760 RepID=A0A4V6P6F6_9BACL|nr:efflux RND transporter permease subunit [Paenibacillus albiflavus]TCZ81022.1 efflux RND transporter permease subunit [Paenibacillus albiflavus]